MFRSCKIRQRMLSTFQADHIIKVCLPCADRRHQSVDRCIFASCNPNVEFGQQEGFILAAIGMLARTAIEMNRAFETIALGNLPCLTTYMTP